MEKAESINLQVSICIWINILYTGHAGVFILTGCSYARRFFSNGLMPITCIVLLLSFHTLGALVIQDSGMHAVAQLGSAGGYINEQAARTESTPNLTLGVNSKHVLNETQFLNYTNSTYGIQINYPSDWDIVLPDAVGSRNDTTSKNKDLQVISKFSSPTRENVTIMIDSLVDDPNNPATVKEFINTVLNQSRNAFAEYRLHDLRISSNSGSNLSIDANSSEFDASTVPIIYNLTYSADQSDSDDRFHIIGMDVGATVNETAYIISYRANVDNYAKYLPVVLEMIHSFKVSDSNKAATPKSSSSQATIASPQRSSSNASALSREQTANLTASPTSPVPSAPTQQTIPPAPGTTADSTYPPTQQLYPPGYSPYPPAGYSPFVDSPYAGYSPYADLLPYAGYSPYADLLPYAGYSPYVIDPFIPTPPFIPPVNPANPTITSYNTYNDTAGVFHIVGEVQNSSPYLITSVQVVATFYDSLGQLLAFDSVYTNPPSISAGQIAFFDLTIPPGTLPVDNVNQWTLRLVWQ